MKGLHIFIPVVLVFVLSQILLKKGVLDLGSTRVDKAFFFQALTSPYVLGALALSGIGVLVWLVVLSRYDLGYANLIISFSYVLIVVSSALIFKEDISPIRWLGTLFITLGVYLVTKS
jgi:drug/metabolite transporter (DMT)-like permease